MSKTRDDLLGDLAYLGFAFEAPFGGISGKRKWRWDAVKDRVAVEYHGIGAHTSHIAGTWRDHEKVTEGQLCGFLVIQCNAKTVNSGDCWTWIMRALGEEAS